jgi:hypothetical protein
MALPVGMLATSTAAVAGVAAGGKERVAADHAEPGDWRGVSQVGRLVGRSEPAHAFLGRLAGHGTERNGYGAVTR